MRTCVLLRVRFFLCTAFALFIKMQQIVTMMLVLIAENALTKPIFMLYYLNINSEKTEISQRDIPLVLYEIQHQNCLIAH